VTFYRALIETRADDSGPEPGEAALESVREAVQPFAGAVSRGSVPRSVSARLSVEADGAAAAAALAAALVTRIAADAGLPAWPVVRVEAVREDIFVEDVARPPAGQREPGS
jgi:hypothetical protein